VLLTKIFGAADEKNTIRILLLLKEALCFRDEEEVAMLAGSASDAEEAAKLLSMVRIIRDLEKELTLRMTV
jgi:hypothetical protein